MLFEADYAKNYASIMYQCLVCVCVCVCVKERERERERETRVRWERGVEGVRL